MSVTPTTLTPASFSAIRWLGSTLFGLVEVPSAWLTNFFDSAEDVWATDPLLSDDEEQLQVGSY